LEEIVNADSGAPCSPRHCKKKQFIDSLKKALLPHSSSKQLTEAAAVTCVKLCKVSIIGRYYIGYEMSTIGIEIVKLKFVRISGVNVYKHLG